MKRNDQEKKRSGMPDANSGGRCYCRGIFFSREGVEESDGAQHDECSAERISRSTRSDGNDYSTGGDHGLGYDTTE